MNEQNGAKQDARSRNLCQAVFSILGGRVQRDTGISDSPTGTKDKNLNKKTMTGSFEKGGRKQP
jgi:hypothetical protein